MLDAHADIWGLGEDSIFNGKLPVFRNELVAAVSDPQGVDAVQRVVLKHSRIIVDRMLNMAKEDMAKSNAVKVKAKTKSSKLKHVVDKMLFNYRNIGECRALGGICAYCTGMLSQLGCVLFISLFIHAFMICIC